MNKKIINILVSLCFIIVSVLTVVDICCFNRSFYDKEYEQLNTAEHIGMSKEALNETTEVLLDYTQGKRDDLSVVVTVKGHDREVFNQREKDHMVDVQALYLNAMMVRNICAGVLFVSLIVLFINRTNYTLWNLSYTYQKVSLIFSVFLVVLITLAWSNFDWFWTKFHHVFFSNDLWLLDPRTDILIMMVPEKFFFDLVTRIILSFLAIFISTNVLSYFYTHKRRTL